MGQGRLPSFILAPSRTPAPPGRGGRDPARAPRSSARSLTFRTCETTAASAWSKSPDNTRSARAWSCYLYALKLRIRLVPRGLGGGSPAGAFARRVVVGRAVVASGPYDTLAALPVRLYGGANPHRRLPPPPLSLGADLRGVSGQTYEALLRTSKNSCSTHFVSKGKKRKG